MPRRIVATTQEVVSGLKDRLNTIRRPNVTSADRPNDGSPGGGPSHADSRYAIIDALPDAAMVLDARLILLHANTLARDVFGALRIGEHIALTTRHPDLAAALNEAQSTNGRTLFELHLRGPVERHLEGTATPLAPARPAGDESSEASAPPIREILVILQDLSERDALARTRVEFVANASHELRTPLASLAGFIETLSGSAKNDAVARERFLGIMAQQAARMRRLIDDLLLLSRVEMRAHLPPTAVVDLNAVVADAVKPLSRLATNSQSTLDWQLSPEAIAVRGDHDELIQAVQNLAQNALKYGRPNGTVTVRVSRLSGGPGRGGWAAISVSDDGAGISPEHLPRLTERFYRVNTASSREKGGTGLGLAIVKHIASRHQGKLDIASEVGKGSVFTISMPTLDQ